MVVLKVETLAEKMGERKAGSMAVQSAGLRVAVTVALKAVLTAA